MVLNWTFRVILLDAGHAIQVFFPCPRALVEDPLHQALQLSSLPSSRCSYQILTRPFDVRGQDYVESSDGA